ncbi:MAG UNVERIFIED_CONTAM: hypothetical protein LVR18_42300 [Planctomycetaceae bacterium]|jgi:hypothetical protein
MVATFLSLSLVTDKQKSTSTMIKNFLSDEAGVIVSAEIVLVATILVLGMIVGLGELRERNRWRTERRGVQPSAMLTRATAHLAGFPTRPAAESSPAPTVQLMLDVPDECDCDQNLTIVCDDPGEKSTN